MLSKSNLASSKIHLSRSSPYRFLKPLLSLNDQSPNTNLNRFFILLPQSAIMQFLNIVAALLASSAIVAAAPSGQPEQKRACPNGWNACGVWNVKLFVVATMEDI